MGTVCVGGGRGAGGGDCEISISVGSIKKAENFFALSFSEQNVICAKEAAGPLL